MPELPQIAVIACGGFLKTKSVMENFFYNDNFYSDMESFIHENFDDESEITELDDDKLFLCKGSKLEPILKLSAEWIAERIDDERFSENNNENEVEKIMKVLSGNIDFDKINALLPKLYYENYKDKFTITKQDLLDQIS
jgi:hypothetical protein